MMSWVGLQYELVVFPGHTRFFNRPISVQNKNVLQYVLYIQFVYDVFFSKIIITALWSITTISEV